MNEQLLAMLLARIDRLERLLYKTYRHSGCADEMEQLGYQLYQERRENVPDESEHRKAARNMIEATNREAMETGG